jgi:hypothetical protein
LQQDQSHKGQEPQGGHLRFQLPIMNPDAIFACARAYQRPPIVSMINRGKIIRSVAIKSVIGLFLFRHDQCHAEIRQTHEEIAVFSVTQKKTGSAQSTLPVYLSFRHSAEWQKP